jgi:opacity protein-like surface antigen
MMKTTLMSAAGGLAGVALASTTFAQDRAGDPGFYISGGGDYLQFEGDNGVDAEIGAVSGRAGFQLSPWLALEGDAIFGVDDGSFDFNGDEDDFDLDDNSDGDVADVINAPGDFGLDYMLGAYAKLNLPVGETFGLYGRAGYAFAEVSSTVATPGGNTIELGDSESGASVGVGGQMHLSDRSSLRLDYTFTDFDLAEAHDIGLMYQFRF